MTDWIENELEITRRRSKDRSNDLLIPIALDSSWEEKTDGKIAWRQLKRKTVLDFSDWKTKRVSKQFTELLDTLKT